MSNQEFEDTLKTIRPIADRMVKAHWLKCYAVSKDGMAYQWTKLGFKKIKQLSDIWDELGSGAFAPQYAETFWSIILRAAVETGIRKSIKQ